jgi:predicted dehydrogenase
MLRLSLVGGSHIYHGKCFGAIFNGCGEGYTEGEWAAGAGMPRIEDARVVKVWEPIRTMAETYAKARNVERVAASLDDCAEDVDGVVIPDDVTLSHQRWASFFIERGLPVFIDKPLAPTYEGARAIVDLAAGKGTPLMSTSAIRYAKEVEDFLAQQAETVGNVHSAVATAPSGQVVFYGIHAVELIATVMGTDVESVENHGAPLENWIHLNYRDGRKVVVAVSARMRQIGAVFYGDRGYHALHAADGGYYYRNQLLHFLDMVKTGKPPVDPRETLRIIDICTAAERALATGRRESLRAD